MTNTPPVFGVTGWKNTGKTTLVTRLVAEFTARGYTVSTIKHAHHNFDIDQKGRDSYKHRHAGAQEVALVSGNRWALMHELRGADEPKLDDVIGKLSACDLILIEGYKRESHPKIESRRVEGKSSEPLAPKDPAIVAIASDTPLPNETLSVFNIDNVVAIADFIADYVKLGAPRKSRQST